LGDDFDVIVGFHREHVVDTGNRKCIRVFQAENKGRLGDVDAISSEPEGYHFFVEIQEDKFSREGEFIDA
jgi:hypothetical protein